VARKGVVTTIDLSGPFFKADPQRTFRQNVRVMMDAVAAEGEADVKAQLRAGNAGRLPIRRIGDHVSEHVVGRTSNLRSRRWAVSANVSVNNRGWGKAQGVSLMAAASSVESRVHAFRKTKNRIGRTRKTNMSELLKGIA
jgi:hypothetical protein